MAQPNVITLEVDEANDATLVDHVFTRYDSFQNRSLYIKDDHTTGSRKTMGFYRTPAKQNGNFRGTDKSSFKFTEDIAVAGVDGTTTIVAPVIVEVSFSFPMGVTAADVLIARQRALALLDRDDVMTPLNSQLLI